jgi:hypothetical protein
MLPNVGPSSSSSILFDSTSSTGALTVGTPGHAISHSFAPLSDVAQFNQKQSPWVWKDTYIFVEDCDKKVQVAHPIKLELVGKDTLSIMDTRGKNVFPRDFCDAAKKPSGVWIEYWWRSPARRKARVRSAIS